MTASSAARDLIALTKPRVTVLVAATAAGGLALAPPVLGAPAVIIALVSIVLVVGSANALNCWLERDVDALMERTRNRPLAAGRLDPTLGLAFGLLLGVAAVAGLAIAANGLTAALALFALVSYVWIYTPLKRVSSSALFVGAVPGAMPPVLGWTAATGTLDAPAVLLFAVIYLWQLPHFLAIGLLRKKDYANAGLRILPVVYGESATHLVSLVSSVALLFAGLAFARSAGLTPFTPIAAVVLGGAFSGAAIAAAIRPADRRAAGMLLFASLLYLPLFFLALGLDVSR